MFRGERIKDLLAEKKVTKKKLAESVGVTAIGLDGIISGSNVRAGNLEKIADFFRLPIDYFFDREVEIKSMGQNEDESSLSDNIQDGISLKKENELLKKIIEEKERLIQVLMSKNQ